VERKPSVDPDAIALAAAEGFGVVHLFSLCRWGDEEAGRRSACDVTVIVNTTPQQRGESLGTFVSQVLMVEPNATAPPDF